MPAASPGADFSSLQSVAARNASYAWAVGSQRATLGARLTPLIERWNGRAWTRANAASPGRDDDWLFGIAAVPKNGFWAVGRAGPATLIERYC